MEGGREARGGLGSPQGFSIAVSTFSQRFKKSGK
jgi:hypothetical protein